MSQRVAKARTPASTNEERFRALVEATTSFVWVADVDGAFAVRQLAWEKYTGHGFAEHGGDGWINDVHPDDRAGVSEVWHRAVQSKSWYEVNWRCWHGATQTWRRCITRGAPLLNSDGSVREWIGAVTDIENRFEYGISGKEWLAMALAAGGMALWEWTPAIGQWRWSSELYQLHGAKSGLTRGELDDFIHPEDRLKVLQARAEAAVSGQIDVTYRIIRPPDEIRWFHSKGGTVPASEPMQLTGCLIDVTAPMRANLELAEANERLSQFRYAISHDLREPLRNLHICFELLAKNLSGKIDAESEKWLSWCRNSAVRMQGLLEDLVVYSKIGDGTATPSEAADSGKAFDEARRNLARSIDEAHAIIEVSELPPVSVPFTSLVHLFQNVLSNAVKYRGPNPPHIRVAAMQHGPVWTFAVADNGIGIDSKHHQRIFEMFRRLHSNSVYEGTGMGLAICKKIVEHHGGRIWVESESEKGSTFYFTFPIL